MHASIFPRIGVRYLVLCGPRYHSVGNISLPEPGPWTNAPLELTIYYRICIVNKRTPLEHAGLPSMFTHDLWCLPVNHASMALQYAQDACLNTNGHDPALIEIHVGRRTRTPNLQCLAILASVSAMTWSSGPIFRTYMASTAQ